MVGRALRLRVPPIGKDMVCLGNISSPMRKGVVKETRGMKKKGREEGERYKVWHDMEQKGHCSCLSGEVTKEFLKACFMFALKLFVFCNINSFSVPLTSSVKYITLVNDFSA